MIKKVKDSVIFKSEYDTYSGNALCFGSYTIAGGIAEKKLSAHTLYDCPSCGCTVSSFVLSSKNVYNTECGECGYMMAMFHAMNQQMDTDNYGTLQITDTEALKKAIYNSLMIYSVTYFNFVKDHLYHESEKQRAINYFFSWLDKMLNISMFRNEASYLKVNMAFSAIESSDRKNIDYNLETNTLLSLKNFNHAFEAIKVGNINIFEEIGVGIPDKALFITMKRLPVFIPLKLLSDSFLKELKGINQTQVINPEKGKSKDIKFTNIYSYPLPSFSITREKIEEIRAGKVKVACKGCGSNIENEDLDISKCVTCNMRLNISAITKKKKAVKVKHETS